MHDLPLSVVFILRNIKLVLKLQWRLLSLAFSLSFYLLQNMIELDLDMPEIPCSKINFLTFVSLFRVKTWMYLASKSWRICTYLMITYTETPSNKPFHTINVAGRVNIFDLQGQTSWQVKDLLFPTICWPLIHYSLSRSDWRLILFCQNIGCNSVCVIQTSVER